MTFVAQRRPEGGKVRRRTDGLGWRTINRLTCDVVEADRPNILAAKIPRPEAATAATESRTTGDQHDMGSA